MQIVESVGEIEENGYATPQHLIDVEWPLRRFDLAEYGSMIAHGFFEPQQHLELMDGLLIWILDRVDLSGEPRRILNTELPLRRLSIGEYQWLIDEGTLAEDERVELLDGLIVDMSPTNPRHANCLDKLASQLYWSIQRRARVRVQSPVELQSAYSQPEPDISVVVERQDEYDDRLPGAEDILLVIEISDSSLEKDQESKLQLYAAAGIRDYWIVNLIDSQFEIYRDPHHSASGKYEYRTKLTCLSGDTINLLAYPDCQISVSDILPEQDS